MPSAPKAITIVVDKLPLLRDAQNKLYQALQEQQWLLEENQHLEVPPRHVDHYNGWVFLIGNFVKRADEASHLDVQRCSLDEKGALCPLTAEQFQHLKQTGELIVLSKLFENQCHIWKVAPSFSPEDKMLLAPLAKAAVLRLTTTLSILQT